MFSRSTSSRRLGRLLSVSATAVALSLVVAACGSSNAGDNTSSSSNSESSAPAGSSTESAPAESGSADGGDHNYAITFLPKNLGNPYFDTSDKGGEKAISEFGGTYKEVGPSEATADAQVSYINTLTQQGVGAIVISANDPNAICSALNQARDAGIKVVTFDSDTDPSCRDAFVNQATAEGIAKAEVDLITKEIGDAGDIAILSASANATNQNAWIDLMKKELTANHPNVKLVDTVYGNDDDQTSFDKTAALLQTYPDLKGIISPTTVGIAAAARYLSTSQYKGKVALTGLGTPNQMRQYIKDGTVTSFALWNPGDLGYLAAYTAKALIDGTITGKSGDKFTAGDLGDYTVGAGATVLLGDPFVFNADNIDDFDF
jgi:rhamnose transport system substrate-binding protein